MKPDNESCPIASMYGIFTYMYHKNQPNIYSQIYHIWVWKGSFRLFWGEIFISSRCENIPSCPAPCRLLPSAAKGVPWELSLLPKAEKCLENTYEATKGAPTYQYDESGG